MLAQRACRHPGPLQSCPMAKTLDSTPPPMASPCPPSSRRTPAAGCSGPSAPTTGATGAQPAQRAFAERGHRHRAVRAGHRGRLGRRTSNSRARSCRRTCASSRCPTTMLDARRRAHVRRRTSTARVRGVDWRFNAWGGLAGGLYFPWDQDDLVAHKVLEIEGCDRYRAPHHQRRRRHPRGWRRAPRWSPKSVC